MGQGAGSFERRLVTGHVNIHFSLWVGRCQCTSSTDHMFHAIVASLIHCGLFHHCLVTWLVQHHGCPLFNLVAVNPSPHTRSVSLIPKLEQTPGRAVAVPHQNRVSLASNILKHGLYTSCGFHCLSEAVTDWDRKSRYTSCGVRKHVRPWPPATGPPAFRGLNRGRLQALRSLKQNCSPHEDESKMGTSLGQSKMGPCVSPASCG